MTSIAASGPLAPAQVLEVFRQSPSFMCFLRGPELVFELANDAYLRLVGDREIIGKRIRDALPELEGQGYFELLSNVLATKEPFVGRNMLAQLRRVAGGPLEPAFVDFTYQPIVDREGRPQGILVHGQDVTARVREEEIHRAILQNLDDGFCIIELLFDEHVRPVDYRFVSVNETFTRHTGLVDPVGKTARQLVPTLDPFWFETYGRVALTGESSRFEQHAPAMRRWFEVFASRVGSPELRCVGLLFKDITERREREAKLRESEARFRNMADNAPVMLWVTGTDAQCTYLNTRWYEFTGQTPESAIGEGWLTAVHPDDAPAAAATFLAAHANHAPFRLEYRLRRHDGIYCWTLDAASPRFDADGTFMGYIGSVIDISARKDLEIERERLLELEQIARREAEETSRIKDEFLTTISHELRTPLSAVVGWSALLKASSLPPAQAAHGIEVIERNARALTRLVEDLLDVGRILAGKLRIELRPIDIATVIEEAIETVRTMALVKNVQLQVATDNSGMVMGDATRLQQVLWNLLTNAIKFTPESGHVRLFAERRDSAMQITVVDDGEGIEPELLPHIFERFRQADGSSKRRVGGLGLGLTMVKFLVEAHGGTVHAASEGPGRGAAFTVRLPVAMLRHANPGAGPPSAHPNVVCPPSLPGVRVLLVDDDVQMLEILRIVLEDCKVIVTTATSAAQALACLRNEMPDVLISDIGMPEQDGYALIEAVRKLPFAASHRFPAIALTAYTRGEERTRALFAGFQSHLAKPVDPLELLATLAALVGDRRPRPEA